MKSFIFALIILLNSSILHAETVNLACGLSQKSKAYSIVVALMAEISKRSDLEINVVHMPRSLMFKQIAEQSSTLHGIAFAMDGMENKYSFLMKVPESVLTLSIVAVARQGDIQINGWKSMQGYKLTYIRGSRNIAKKLKAAGLSANPLTDIEQGLKMTKHKRADIFLTTPLLISATLAKPEYKELKILKPVLDINDHFSYFFQKHETMVPKYLQALQEIKKDGTYEKITGATK